MVGFLYRYPCMSYGSLSAIFSLQLFVFFSPLFLLFCSFSLFKAFAMFLVVDFYY